MLNGIIEYDIINHFFNFIGYNLFCILTILVFLCFRFCFQRAIINSLIAVAALITQEKVLSRIAFAELDEVSKEVPHSSLPHYIRTSMPAMKEAMEAKAGGGSRVDPGSVEEVLGWVQNRLRNFPALPDI